MKLPEEALSSLQRDINSGVDIGKHIGQLIKLLFVIWSGWSQTNLGFGIPLEQCMHSFQWISHYFVSSDWSLYCIYSDCSPET